MERLFTHIKEHYKRYVFLFLLLAISGFLLFRYYAETRDYYKRQDNSIAVVGRVTNSEYKERETTEFDSEDMPYTVTESYYLIKVEYEYQEKSYLWTYESVIDVSTGQEMELFIDSKDPTQVFNEGPGGSGFLFLGLIFLAIFALSAIFLVFKMNSFFILFGLGAVGFLIAAVGAAMKLSFLSIIFFVASLAFAAVTFLFHRLFKSK